MIVVKWLDAYPSVDGRPYGACGGGRPLRQPEVRGDAGRTARHLEDDDEHGEADGAGLDVAPHHAPTDRSD